MSQKFGSKSFRTLLTKVQGPGIFGRCLPKSAAVDFSEKQCQLITMTQNRGSERGSMLANSTEWVLMYFPKECYHASICLVLQPKTTVTIVPHNLEVVGSNPAPATLKNR
jgi:hypothetical protein